MNSSRNDTSNSINLLVIGGIRPPFSVNVLSDGSLVLTLDGTCIQTTTKHAHRELTMALLEDRTTDPAVETLVDLLERFLSTTDFAALRAEHPELAGQTICHVRLYRHDDGSVLWEVVSSR